jgi:DDE_Tnp_1-associated
MPGQSAMSSAGDSSAAVHVLSARLGDGLSATARLPEFLAGVPDHRRAQGRRHSLTSILSLACAAVAAGSRSLTAIAEWGADTCPLTC